MIDVLETCIMFPHVGVCSASMGNSSHTAGDILVQVAPHPGPLQAQPAHPPTPAGRTQHPQQPRSAPSHRGELSTKAYHR